MPTSVTLGTSRPLATRLVPTRTSDVPAVKASMTRSAAPRRSATSRSSRATRSRGMRLADLAFDALRAAAEIADPRRAAVRTARRERRRSPAVVTAQRRAGLVVDERAFAVGAGLDVAAVATQDDRCRTAPIEDEDRLVAGRRIERGERVIERARQQRRGCPRQARRAGRRPRSRERRPVGRVGRTTRS